MSIPPTSTAIMASSISKDISTTQNTLSVLEEQISTGMTISSASQNPSQAAQMLGLESQLARAKQFASNAEDATGRLSLTTTTLNSIYDVLLQVQSTLGSITDTVTASAGYAGAIATITDARSQLLTFANTKYDGQAIFSGTGTPSRAYNTTGVYVGGSTVPTRTVAPEMAVSVGTTGPDVFGPTATTGKTGLLGKTGILATIVAALKSGTPTAISAATSTGVAALGRAVTRVLGQATDLGVAADTVRSYVSQAKGVVTMLTDQLSSIRDVTMAEAATNLTLQQTSYQAALEIASELNSDSLVQYLS